MILQHMIKRREDSIEHLMGAIKYCYDSDADVIIGLSHAKLWAVIELDVLFKLLDKLKKEENENERSKMGNGTIE